MVALCPEIGHVQGKLEQLYSWAANKGRQPQPDPVLARRRQETSQLSPETTEACGIFRTAI
eukprot:1052253-Pyramimonas_sp.AAC.1